MGFGTQVGRKKGGNSSGSKAGRSKDESRHSVISGVCVEWAGPRRCLMEFKSDGPFLRK